MPISSFNVKWFGLHGALTRRCEVAVSLTP